MLNQTSQEAPTALDATVRRAQIAFETARATSPLLRSGWLKAIAESLDSNASDLVDLAHMETHLSIPRLESELRRTSFQIRLLAEETLHGYHFDARIDHSDESWGMGPRPDLRRINEPLGVVGVFGASNFPFAFSVLGGDTASALAAGCSVVHKAHSAHPRLATASATLAAAALDRAGAPSHLLSLVHGRGAGVELVSHRYVRAIGFTGSTSGGRYLYDIAANRPDPIPFFGELGSTNPVFVSPAAWIDRREDILRGYVSSVSLGMGQFCTKPGFIVVPRTDRAELKRMLEAATSTVVSHPMLTDQLRLGYEAERDDLVSNVALERLFESTEESGNPPLTFMLMDASAAIADPSLLTREMFGPGSVVVQYAAFEEVLELARRLEGQLAVSVQANADEDLGPLVPSLEMIAGRLLWNEWPTGVSVTYAQQHGGPYPASTAAGTTSVGTAAIARFTRPVAYQGFPDSRLPPGLQDANPWGIIRRVDGERKVQ